MIDMTPEAIARIKSIKKALRITVAGGGCSGFQYMFEWCDITENDITFTKDGASIVTDQNTLEMMEGSIVHFKEDLVGSRFVIQNPQAVSSCGCGNSFS